MEKIKKLKKILKEEKIDGYVIPKNDEFFNEYVSDYNDRLNYISNFSGSFGFALILKNSNYLFVDGRYTLQAKEQSGKFFKIITIPKKMPNDILRNKKLNIGFDPRLFTKKTIKIFFGKNNCKFEPKKINFVDKIWKRKEQKNIKKFYNLPRNCVGVNHKSKIKKVVKNLRKKGADVQFITASENIAWLFNIRGYDADYSPLPYSYVLVDKYENVSFFCDLSKIPSVLKKNFNEIQFIEIGYTSKILSKINKRKFIIDENTCSFYFENIIMRKNKIINYYDPIYLLKAIKDKIEIRNIEAAHISDGIALTKYLFWVKKNVNKRKITEMSATQKLFQLRKKNKKFKFLSFPTISGSGPNGAIIHYRANKKTDRKLKNGDIYLVDSGGQYEFGTTDVTRTISLNNKSERIKNIFTRVLKGHIAVASFQLSENTNGSKIDTVARKYLKQIGLNYAHGTGHGVGYFLNVHEGPQAISRNNKIRLLEGMVVSNEPGYYEKNKFGIRIENLIYIKKIKNKNYFKNFTMVPIDKDLVVNSMLNKNEKRWLNDYHREVYKNLRDGMNKNEIGELKKACSAI